MAKSMISTLTNIKQICKITTAETKQITAKSIFLKIIYFQEMYLSLA